MILEIKSSENLFEKCLLAWNSCAANKWNHLLIVCSNLYWIFQMLYSKYCLLSNSFSNGLNFIGGYRAFILLKVLNCCFLYTQNQMNYFFLQNNIHFRVSLTLLSNKVTIILGIYLFNKCQDIYKCSYYLKLTIKSKIWLAYHWV